MTNEEVRNILFTSVHPQTTEEAEAIGIAVKAVERMIPKKFDENSKDALLECFDHGDVYVLKCPNCGTRIALRADNEVVELGT